MIRLFLNPRIIALTLALIGAVAFFAWPSAPVTASMCDDGTASGMQNEWVYTSEAQFRTNVLQECGAGERCVEWCTIHCGNVTPQNYFRCEPI